MVCPKCGSDHTDVKLRSAGTSSKTNYFRTGGKGWALPSGQKTRNSKRKYRSIALCKDCGHVWEPGKENQNNSLAGIIGILALIFVLSAMFRGCELAHQKDTADEGASETETVDDGASETEATSLWASEPTPLSEFEYYIGEDGIHIKKCTSNSEAIYVSAEYEYEGRVLPVISIEEGMAFRRPESIIIDEGICEIVHSAFNSCGVKYLYLPSTLTDFDGWSYFHHGEKLYYGGDKDSWSELFTWDRSSLDFIEIICNASIQELQRQSD